MEEKAALVEFLDAQRACVLTIIEGLDDQQLTTAVLPSAWTPLGMVEHLGYAERHWFQEVLVGEAVPAPWPDDDHALLTTPRSRDTVFGFYAEQRAITDRAIATHSLDAVPKEKHDGLLVPDLRWIILHMIEETARHAGHLDIVRELLDGTTGLAPR
jgi:Protein of unknown function (DUF664)